MLLVPLLLFLAMPSYSKAAPPEVMEAAQQGLTMLPKVVTNKPAGTLTLGDFFLLHTMHPNAVKSATRGVGSLIQPAGMWLAIVLLNDQPYLMMTLDQVGGTWKAVGFGSEIYANELWQIRKAWPEAAGYQLRNVRFYQARADMVHVVDRTGREVGFVPLTSAKIAYKLQQGAFNPKALLSDSKVLTASKAALAAAQL